MTWMPNVTDKQSNVSTTFGAQKAIRHKTRPSKKYKKETSLKIFWNLQGMSNTALIWSPKAIVL